MRHAENQPPRVFQRVFQRMFQKGLMHKDKRPCNSPLYRSLSYVAFCRVRPQGAPCFGFVQGCALAP